MSQWATGEGCREPGCGVVAEGDIGMADLDGAAPVREVTISPAILADMTGYLRSQGVDADAVCRRAGIDASTVATTTARIPGRAMADFWRESIAASGDADLGMHATAAANPGALDIVGYVMLSCTTADEALRRGARLIRLLNDGLAIEIVRERTKTRCHLVFLEGREDFMQGEPRQVVETILFGIVHQVRLLTGRHVIPASVSLRHNRPPTGDREHVKLFGVKPRFSATEDVVILANDDLDVTLRSGNASLLAAFEAHAASALEALGASDTIAGRVSSEVVAQLKGEAPSISGVARAMAMSERNLQRRLAAEGTTFQSVLDAARRELAIRHLSDPGATVAKVAWLVGFSEPSAFHRAFRRWTGQSPRALA